MKRNPDSQRIAVQIANLQRALPVDEERLRRAVQRILEKEALREAQISVAVVDDPTIRRLNRTYLNQDSPTDVLSFVLEQSEGRFEGEVVVSAETAQRAASRFGWSAADELLLYVIHGTLHLAGYDDRTPAQRARMQTREKAHLAHFGLEPRYEEPAGHNCDSPAAPVAGSSSGGTKRP